MPATDALSPPLSPAAREIIKSYGGWTAFMQSYGLKPYDEDDIAEAKNIVEQMVEYDEQDQNEQ